MVRCAVNCPRRDPVSHGLIVLFGCAQIAAQGRDCLTARHACVAQSIEGLTAYAIVWVLLLGKIAFAAYALYCYFNEQPSFPKPLLDAPTSADNGTVGAGE